MQDGPYAPITSGRHGIAWYLYLDDNDECFPVLSGAGTGVLSPWNFGGKDNRGQRLLNSYLDVDSGDDKGALEIFHCPDDIKGIWGEPLETTFDFMGNSYVWNTNILTHGAPSLYAPRPLSTITSPRHKVYLEMCFRDNNPGHGGKRSIDRKVMVLFVDGHVTGPFLWPEDFETSGGDKVLEDPN